MTSADDEVRFLNEGWRLLGREVQSRLLARGWAVVNLDIADDAPLEFFWPPTAPPAYGVAVASNSSETHGGTPNPWIQPTRITRIGSAWHVHYGQAIAQSPDAPIEHADDQSLLEDLPRIEWWPMSLDEARRLQNERVLHRTHADAYDQHSLGYSIRSEPYESRLQELLDRMRSKTPLMMGDPDAWRWAGDLHARARIIDGEMWASAIRTAQAGGEGWGPSGPTNIEDEQ